MRPSFPLALTLAASVALSEPAGAQDPWSLADQEIHRLTPAAFRQLPASVIAALEEKRCTIPQSSPDSIPHNVIRGSFGKKGQTDWAVLCSRARASTIVIVWGGPAACPDEMEVRKDRSYLLKDSEDRIRFSRRIEVAEPVYIIKMHERFGGEPPPPLEHQGINDSFLGKGSTIRYCKDNRWLELTGDQLGRP